MYSPMQFERIAQTHALMMAWHGPHRCLPEVDYADSVYALSEQEGFEKIDIVAKLASVSSEGLSVLEKHHCLSAQLFNVKHTLEDILEEMHQVDNFQFFQYLGCDNLELRAASSLMEVNELLRKQSEREGQPLPVAAVKDLKHLQVHCQDLALLSCSRFLSQTTLQSKGIPPELLHRLEAAFGTAALQDDVLWSRLGNAKYHVFTNHMRFGARKHRHGRGGRKSRAAKEAAKEEKGEPMKIPVPS